MGQVQEINGLWTARFSTDIGTGSGVISLVSGRLLGGDSNYFYSGSYRVDPTGKAVNGILRVVHFFGPLSNVFGPYRELNLSFAGAVGNGLIIVSARSTILSHLTLSVRLERVERLEELR